MKLHEDYHVRHRLKTEAFLHFQQSGRKIKMKNSMLKGEPLAGGGSADNFLGLGCLKTYDI